MERLRFLFKHRALVLSVSVVSALCVGLLVLYPILLRLTPGEGKRVELFDFEHGSTVRKIATELKEREIINSSGMFLLYSRLHRYDGRIKAGTYRFNDAMPVAEILRKLVAGEVDAEKFAVPEGYSIYQIAELLEAKKLLDKDRFLRACVDPLLLKELGINGASVEGYLFPSTYDITHKMSEADLIRQMVAQFEKVCGTRFSTNRTEGERSRILILASMVEKEAMAPEERRVISSVFFNRLKKGMRLQSDPTAVYGVRAFAGKVTKGDIVRPSPYNTYVIPGLPPGPVGNPGIDAIDAVLNPAATDYLYFVSRKDGTHHFSSTLDEHNRAVRRYLKSVVSAGP